MERKFYFQFKNSKIKRVILIKNSLFFRWVKIEKKLFLFLSLCFLLLSFFEKKILGIFLISLSLFGFSFLRDSFFENFLKKPKAKGKNLADFLDFNLAKAIFEAQNFSKKKKFPLNSSILLFFLLNLKDWKTNFIFSRLLIDRETLKNKLKEGFEKREGIEDILREALKIAKEKVKERIEISDILPVLSEKNEIFRKFLIETELKIQDVKDVADWADYLEREFLEQRKFWEWKNLVRKGVLAREWTAGYTIFLDRFSFDLTKAMKKQKFRKIFAHQKEVQELERILAAPQKNDALIVGEAGSGRRSMLESLARRCAIGESLPELNFNRVVYLDMQKLISVTQTTEEAEDLLDRIFEEVIKAGNVILVIDNIHQYIGVQTERKAGILEISGILSSYLPSPLFRLVGITTPQGLHQNLELRPSILEYFEKIEVPEITERETLFILEDRALRLEAKYKIFFPLISLKKIISLCSRYLTALPFPEKAIEVIDETSIFVAQKRERIVLPSHIATIVTRKSKIPVGDIEEVERVKLLNLEKLLHQRIVDQEEAVKEIANSLRRARAEIKLKKGPIGCFLFLGPTGVGKTETAKALSEVYFGSEEKMIRLDMSEFQDPKDIERLLGTPGTEGLLTTPVRENPFSLILLDEFEKTHPKILNLFLQVFDEGHLTDGQGRKVDFKNTIIIATSNAGYKLIFRAVQEGKDWGETKKELINSVIQEGIFRPELLNRFDAVVLFKPLTKENLMKIAQLMLKKVQKKLKEKEIYFEITDKLKERIVELSYKPEFGAREMQRVIQEKIGNPLARAILEGRVKRGEKVGIDPQTFEIIH